MFVQQIIKVAKSLRAAEALIITGFVFIGGAYSFLHATTFQWQQIVLLFVVSYTLMLSVFTSNALFGNKHDKINPRLKPLGSYSGNYYLILTVLLYAISVCLCIIFFPKVIILHVVTFILCFLYSVPGFGKHLPIVGTVIHFFVEVLLFNFAYMFFNPISANSIAISVYFAMMAAAGHLHHEVIDYEVDLKNNIKTSAVTWGYKSIEIVSFSLFAVAHLYLGAVLLYGIGLPRVFIIFIIGFLVHSFIFFYYYRQIENGIKSRMKYRSAYRAIYFVCGLIFLYVLWKTFSV